MKLIGLALLIAAAAHASLIAALLAEAGGVNTVLRCQANFAPQPSFDVACSVPNPVIPSNPAWAEVAARGPMHVFLENIGGANELCRTGCTDAQAFLQYNDLWTITGGTGVGTLDLNFAVGGTLRPYPATQTGVGVQNMFDPLFHPNSNNRYDVYVPFVYDVPFAFSFSASMGSGIGGYGVSTLSLDAQPVFYEGSCSVPVFCSQLHTVAGTVTSGIGDPFLELPAATLVVVPEPATAAMAIWIIAGVFKIAKRRRAAASTRCVACSRPPGLPSGRRPTPLRARRLPA